MSDTLQKLLASQPPLKGCRAGGMTDEEHWELLGIAPQSCARCLSVALAQARRERDEYKTLFESYKQHIEAERARWLKAEAERDDVRATADASLQAAHAATAEAQADAMRLLAERDALAEWKALHIGLSECKASELRTVEGCFKMRGERDTPACGRCILCLRSALAEMRAKTLEEAINVAAFRASQAGCNTITINHIVDGLRGALSTGPSEGGGE